MDFLNSGETRRLGKSITFPLVFAMENLDNFLTDSDIGPLVATRQRLERAQALEESVTD